MALTGCRREVVQPFDLPGAELDAVRGGVLFDARNLLGARKRGDRMHGVGAADRGGTGLGQSDVANLAFGDQFGRVEPFAVIRNSCAYRKRGN